MHDKNVPTPTVSSRGRPTVGTLFGSAFGFNLDEVRVFVLTPVFEHIREGAPRL